jgi:branched-chain amino acid transport system substrate-binding protein
MKKVIIGFLLIVMVAGLILSGCSSSPASSPAPQTGAKTIKIGVVFNLGTSVGLDALHGIQLMVEEDNKNGGIDIGGEKYKVELISYDNQGSQTSEVSATNRLVFEDKVKYILTVGQFQGAWLSTTESNKVIVMSQDFIAPVDLAANTRYSFNPGFSNANIPAEIGWYCKTYPDKVKNFITAYPDNQFGHMLESMTTPTLKAFGVAPNSIFFPAQQVDISAVCTKIVSLNPTTVMCLTADANTDAIAMDSLHKAGYRGQLYLPTSTALGEFLQFTSPEVLEGFITGMYTTEPDPAVTPTAKHFKELWIAKYGKWDNPNILSTGLYSPLVAALNKAGSLDTDKVSDTIASGMEFSSPIGDGKMISRPDLGNNRTVDSISTYYVKQVVGGKIKLLSTISPDRALEYFRVVNPPLPPGVTPGPPPGGPPHN